MDETKLRGKQKSDKPRSNRVLIKFEKFSAALTMLAKTKKHTFFPPGRHIEKLRLQQIKL